MTHVLIVQPDGTGSLTDLTELDDFRKAIGGGFVQMLRGGTCFALVDEDAKLLGAPNNPLATTLAMKLGYEAIPPDFLAGPVIFHSGVVDERTIDISEHVIKVAVGIGIAISNRPSWA